MDNIINPRAVGTALILVLVAWRLYARLKRLIARQKFSPRRPWITVVFFPILLLSLAMSPTTTTMSLAALAVSVAVGVGLGVYGNRLTKFERTAEGLFYTPNAHIGIALTALFAARIVYRFLQIYWLDSTITSRPPAELYSSPLTLAIFGTMAGYYVSYAIGLLMWKRRVDASPEGATSPTS
jgi:hypothetical protein